MQALLVAIHTALVSMSDVFNAVSVACDIDMVHTFAVYLEGHTGHADAYVSVSSDGCVRAVLPDGSRAPLSLIIKLRRAAVAHKSVDLPGAGDLWRTTKDQATLDRMRSRMISRKRTQR